MSRAHGAGQTAQLRAFHRVSWGLTLILIVMMTSVLALSGRWIAHRWLGDATGFDLFEFMMLLALTCVSALWNASAVVMVAINAHLRLSAIYVATNGALLAIAATLAPHWGLPAMMSSLLATEIILLLWVMPTVLSLTADAPLAFLKNAPLAGVQLLISRVSRALPAPR